MLKVVRSGVTFANVVALLALFVALGGGAYALSGIPDSGGVYRGCVASSGALRVVTKASSCLKARTVKRGSRRVRIPGESAIVWNQQGRPGVNGAVGPQGLQGLGGAPGQPGSPAASINTGIVTTTTAGGFGPPSGRSDASLTESDVQTLTPAGAPITARDLSVSWPSGFSLASGRTAVATLRVNGADTLLSCPMPVGGNTCQDTSHAVTIPPNARISLSFQQGGSGAFGTTPWSFGWRAVP